MMMSSINKFYFVLLDLFIFILFPHIISLARTSSVKLKRSGEKGHQFLKLKRELQFSHYCDVSICFYIFFYQVATVPF